MQHITHNINPSRVTHPIARRDDMSHAVFYIVNMGHTQTHGAEMAMSLVGAVLFGSSDLDRRVTLSPCMAAMQWHPPLASLSDEPTSLVFASDDGRQCDPCNRPRKQDSAQELAQLRT